ncbi:unnamed protein product [Enterobius vermicularis]|uniref:SH2 domain-containing protein n=1 Tax=Enterobius vermicularis TaxID=51028 RepID=A0A0N4V0Z3_ENTVE|nr:unnamed protein product [Enterobius vermicularis]
MFCRTNGIFLGREGYFERDFIHYDVDRVLAEGRLINCDVGTFLIRLRQNNSLALSIRATKKVLHIKLEIKNNFPTFKLHNNLWVLGEGPSFTSIASVIRYYRTHPLPIRGADHVLLRTPILAANSF